MRRVSFIVMFSFVLSFGYALRAAEAPSPEYVKAMKTLGALVGGLSKPGASEDFEAVKKASAEAKAAFAVTENFWKAKGDAEALKLAEAGSKYSADLGVVANLTSSEGVEAAVKDIASTCKPCHDGHREKAAEGFVIK